MKKILVVGSMNMDYSIYCNEFPQAGETVVGNNRYVQPGGKGANQCFALAQSKLANVSIVSARGCDAEGEYIEEFFKRNNVKTYIEKIVDKPTGNATILIDKNGENRIVIIKGANGEVKPNEKLEKIIKENDMVILQNEIPIETNEWIVEKAHEMDKVVVYNPAPFCVFSHKIYAKIDYFVVNEVELSQYSKEKSVEKGAQKMLSLGVKNVVVTLGKNGAVLYNKNEHLKTDIFEAKVVDTVSAGDTFVGYFSASIINGFDHLKSLKIANAASSITVSKKGSMISIPNCDEVKKIFNY